MKKQLTAIMLVLAMLTMFTRTAAAAPQMTGTAALAGVIYVPGKGPVFTFSVLSGKFSRSELKGFVHVEGGADYGLHCIQVDDSTVTCTTSKKTAGENVVVYWGGAIFWAQVPAAPEFCYSVYDWSYPLSSSDHWVGYGSYCQDTPANYGNLVEWDNPVWGDSPYIFLPGSPACFTEDIWIDGYYFPGCPFPL